MKTLTIICLFFLPGSFASGQITDHIVYKQSVILIYKQVFEKRLFKESIDQLNHVKLNYGMLYGEDYMLMSYCYKEMGNDSLAAIYLKEACSVPSFDMRVTWYIENLNPGYISEGFNEQNMKLKDEGFENSWNNYRAKNADSLIAIIDSMTYWDQFYRDQWHMNPESSQFQQQLDLMNKQSEEFLVDMIQRIGFPGEKRLQLGEFCIWPILVHSAGNEEFFQRMKPVFLNEVKIGNMSPWMYASWVDQHQYYNNLPTMYNTQVGLKNDFTKKEREEISKNRFEIGLVDLEYSLPKN